MCDVHLSHTQFRAQGRGFTNSRDEGLRSRVQVSHLTSNTAAGTCLDDPLAKKSRTHCTGMAIHYYDLLTYDFLIQQSRAGVDPRVGKLQTSCTGVATRC